MRILRNSAIVAGLVLGAAALADAPTGKAPVVLVEPAHVAELADLITYPARVTSKINAGVYAPNDGVITSLPVTLGRTVRAGEALLRIKNTDPVYEYVPVPVEAPVAGVISTLDVTLGARVTKGQALATITDPSKQRLVVEVPASDLGRVQSGLEGTLAVPALGAKALPVKIAGLSPLVDPATGTATAELDVVGSPTALPLGALGKVTFATNKRQGIQVPEQAIVYRGKDTLVRIVDGGKAKLAPVQIAETRKGLTEIASGLKDGVLVIVRASGFVADGQDVTVQNGDVAKK
jgi:multidrug efflux pump subunit AcrA (membrane-fusion protein)